MEIRQNDKDCWKSNVKALRKLGNPALFEVRSREISCIFEVEGGKKIIESKIKIQKFTEQRVSGEHN